MSDIYTSVYPEVARAAAAAFTEMAGWMAHDAGNDVLAEQPFHRALAFAGLGNDRQLEAHVFGSMSHLTLYFGRPGETRLAAQPWEVGQAVDPLGGEPAKTASHRCWMAANPRSDRGDMHSLPAQGDDGGSLDPVGRGMPSPGQPADLAFFRSSRGGRARNSFGMAQDLLPCTMSLLTH